MSTFFFFNVRQRRTLAGSTRRGQTWAVSDVVVKPVDDEAEANWIADLAARVEQRGFRLARPIAAPDGHWIVDGWSAWTRVAGEHSSTRWAELLDAADAFHEAVADVPKPEFIDRRQDRWRIADRVAWGDRAWEEFDGVAHVPRLIAARRPLALPSQLVHGDLGGPPRPSPRPSSWPRLAAANRNL